ncbi:MAG: hypothetical protein WDN30_11220 [Pararobbsia sp.]
MLAVVFPLMGMTLSLSGLPITSCSAARRARLPPTSNPDLCKREHRERLMGLIGMSAQSDMHVVVLRRVAAVMMSFALDGDGDRMQVRVSHRRVGSSGCSRKP